jgi:poly-gamma-glutamate capsule biosynthesis protein CapA/YwtB (metallophosphatase superfamily)
MKDVEEILQSADITFGNLEGVLLDEGGTPKSCRDPKVCYVFRSPSRYVENLTTAGFDLISVANNHAGDFGDAGRTNTMKVLAEQEIAYAGQLQQEFTILTKDSITYGLAAFAPNTNCVNINDYNRAKAIVQHLDSIVDVVIVSFHGGAEGKDYQHVPRKHEIFHGEDRGNVYQFTHMMVDAGADVIFGHGPHVTRGVEVYKDRFIAYSLGNFCTYKGINIAGINGWAPIIKVFTNPSGVFLHGEITATYQVYGVGVKIDPNKQVIKKIKELSQKDFPESTIGIDDNGIITYLDRL